MPNLFDQFLVTDCPRPHPPPVTQTSGGMQVWQTVSSVRQRARNAEQITKKWGNSVHTPDIPRCFCCRLWCIQYINDVYMIYEYLLWCTWVYIYILSKNVDDAYMIFNMMFVIFHLYDICNVHIQHVFIYLYIYVLAFQYTCVDFISSRSCTCWCNSPISNWITVGFASDFVH